MLTGSPVQDSQDNHTDSVTLRGGFRIFEKGVHLRGKGGRLQAIKKGGGGGSRRGSNLGLNVLKN